MNRIVSLAVAVSLLSSVLLAANKKITDTHEEARCGPPATSCRRSWTFWRTSRRTCSTRPSAWW
jgi:hypothetical protein